ncbi:MAG TPA: glycosyltransferase family 4 protein [Candidatus Krumholzibacteria bacterium]|nr:glycosyltransferase family 4 protein [Candidatus Krumholzibacteria bacterium]
MSSAGSPARIAVVASTFGVGGAERVTADVVRRLDRSRFEARMFFLHDAGVVGRELFREGFAGCERIMKRRGDRLGALRLVSHLRSFRPHVVFCLDHHDAMTMGRLAGLISGANALVVASHATSLVGKRRLFDPLDRLLMEFTRRVVAVSRSHAEVLRRREGVERERIAVIENGVDLAAWPFVSERLRAESRAALELGPDDQVVLMVAGLRPEKAHEVLLAATARLQDRGRRVRVLLAGDGERRAAIEAAAVALGVRANVEFLGTRRDIARLLHASDAVVLPSSAEALPLALLEAMAAGTPVIASAVGSIPEVVRDGDTGLLIQPGDDVSLADRIGVILDDEARAAGLRVRARACVAQRYSIDETASRYQALFEEVMAA